jgi:hypothetical protein
MRRLGTPCTGVSGQAAGSGHFTPTDTDSPVSFILATVSAKLGETFVVRHSYPRRRSGALGRRPQSVAERAAAILDDYGRREGAE